MKYPDSRVHPVNWLILLVVLLSLSPVSSMATPRAELHEKFEEIEDDLFDNGFGIPIYLESGSDGESMRGDVYGVIYHPFISLSDSLAAMPNWCKIIPQHLNIKACTYQYINNQCQLMFYSGRKFYEKADDVYQLEYQFQILAQENNFLSLRLTANEGPLDTEHYLIRVNAIPLSEQSTFIHFSYQYRFGIWTRLAMATYFATLGHDKVGFTITGQDDEANPVYVDGIRGVIERNSIRYYFAIRSFLTTQNVAREKQFNARINTWFDLTERYQRQLYEMDKPDYIKYKTKEHKDQMRLQELITQDKTVIPANACE